MRSLWLLVLLLLLGWPASGRAYDGATSFGLALAALAAHNQPIATMGEKSPETDLPAAVVLQATLLGSVQQWQQANARAAADAAALAALLQAPPTGWPVAGKLHQDFGEQDATGVPLAGARLLAKAGSGIYAPEAAKVAYVGELKGFGLVVMLQANAGDYLVLGGFGQTDVLVGAPVAAGDLLGRLPGGIVGPASPQTLYFERRRGGIPVRPLPELSS